MGCWFWGKRLTRARVRVRVGVGGSRMIIAGRVVMWSCVGLVASSSARPSRSNWF